jgi:hypothetical protein
MVSGAGRSPSVIYLAGHAHSGSTVVGSDLGMTSQIQMLGEVKSLSRIYLKGLCTCGRPFTECAVWSAVVDQLGDLFTLNRSKNEGSRRQFRDNRTLFWHISQNLGASNHLLDSSKTLPRLRHIEADGVEHRVLHLARNPVSFAESRLKSIQRHRPGSFQNAGTERDFYRTHIRKWAREVIQTRHFLVQKRIPFLSLRYEDWLRRKKETISRISGFTECDLPQQREVIDVKGQHQLAGNRVRFQSLIPLAKPDSDAEIDYSMALKYDNGLTVRTAISLFD